MLSVIVWSQPVPMLWKYFQVVMIEILSPHFYTLSILNTLFLFYEYHKIP